jgi:thiol-disulfide isomerase/thioredoxin
MLVITAGAVVLAGLVVAGVFAAAGTGPARANLPAPTATAADAGARTADADPAPRAARPTGTGAPIRISGTDPVTGRRVDLAAFTGKPVVLAIWASWGPGCNDEAPHLATVARSRTDVHFVGLNYRDSRDGARGFTERYGWTFPSIGDPDGELAFRLGLQGTPTTLFLDSEHREIGRIVGATDAAGFSEAVDRITAS